jgi:hypothetical protein
MDDRSSVWGMKGVKLEQGGWERKERLRADGCPERAKFVLR